MSIFERKAAKILNKAGIEINGSNPWDVQIKDKSTVSYTHLRAHETVLDLVCRLLLEKKKTK